MKKRMLLSLVAMFMVVASAPSVFAGAWTAKQGAFYDKVAFNYYYSHQTF